MLFSRQWSFTFFLWIQVILHDVMLKVLTNENKGIKTKKLWRYIFMKMICIEMIKKTWPFKKETNLMKFRGLFKTLSNISDRPRWSILLKLIATFSCQLFWWTLYLRCFTEVLNTPPYFDFKCSPFKKIYIQSNVD